MEREALKLALHELEGIPFYRNYGVRISNAIAAIKEALAQPAQDVDYWIREATAARQAEMALRRELEAQPAHEQWNAALDEAAARIGEIKGFGQATQDSFAVFIKGLKR